MSNGSAEVSFSLVGTDLSGEDIFTETLAAVTPGDLDTQLDTFDARVNGGFPQEPATGCLGEGCQGPVPGLVASGLVQSSSAVAEGDLPGVSHVSHPPRPATRAQLLARALKKCKAKRVRSRRKICERHARRHYGLKTRARKLTRNDRRGS